MMIQNDIATKQNEQTFIDRLAAQRHLYSKAKSISLLVFIGCVIMPVLLAIAKVLFPSCTIIPKVIVIYSFVATLLGIWLKDVTSRKKDLTARIQQLFDTELFNLGWNGALCGTKPKPEEIHSELKGASYKNLKDWYDPIVSQLPISVGALVCMRINVVYDQSLRKSYSNLCCGLTILAMIAVVSLGMLNNPKIWDAFLYGIIPLMPLITWRIDSRKQHSASLSALNNIENLIESGLMQAQSDNIVNKETLVEIQNFIFIHRKSSCLIPNKIYKTFRKKNEKAAQYGVKQICEMYNFFR